MAEVFDPAGFPPLIALGQRLRELAGESAYRAGRDYLRGGMIKDLTVTDVQAMASVRGSTDYRVSISFGAAGAASVTCTCPAHRRSTHCKHVVAVAVALVEQPRLFQIVPRSEIPVVAPPTRKRRDPGAKQKAEALKEEQRQTGLILVDRVLEELTAMGIGGLGPEQLALVASVAETVQGLKLRRLGNALIGLNRLVVERGQDETTPTAFASLLAEIAMMRQVIGASLSGAVALDSALAEELIGKTWRAKDLEQVTGLQLVTLARETHDEGEFRVESMYLFDLPTRDIFVERQITPRGLRGERFPIRRMKTLVDEAGVYPGQSPRRIKIVTARRGALLMADIDAIVASAIVEISELRRRLVERLAAPVGSTEVAVVFRPVQIVATGDLLAGLDGQGDLVSLVWPGSWSAAMVRGMTREPERCALFGVMELARSGPLLRCLSIIGDLGWANCPTYPDVA